MALLPSSQHALAPGDSDSDSSALRLALYRCGRAEIVFGDGSALVLHSPDASRASYFGPDGLRLRFLTACAPRRRPLRPLAQDVRAAAAAQGRAEGPCRHRRGEQVRAKVGAAVCLWSRFVPVPFAGPPGEEIAALCAGPEARRLWRHARLCHVRWSRSSLSSPSTGAAAPRGGAVRVASTDGIATLTLAPHGYTYVVEWWCPLGEACRVETGPSGEGMTLYCGADGAAPRGKGVARGMAGEANASVCYEHVSLVQCFAVADAPEPAWAYALFLALAEHVRAREATSEKATTSDARLTSVEVALRQHMEDGTVVDAGTGEVLAALPLGLNVESELAASNGVNHSRGAWIGDAVSPAVVLGATGAGPVRVMWTPDMTMWFHLAGIGSAASGEATIQMPPAAASDGCAVLASTQGCRFWQCLGPMGDSLGVVASCVLPVDSASALLSECVSEALRWLRFNRSETSSAAAAACACAERRPPPTQDAGRSGDARGWLLERDFFEEGVGRLSVFAGSAGSAGAGSPRLVRVLFADASRLEFSAGPALARPAAGCPFRLLTASGEVLQRSFGLPLGCEAHAHAACALLARVAEPAAARQRQRHASALAAQHALAATARGSALLRAHGVLRGGSVEEGGVEAAVEAALRRTRAVLAPAVAA